MQVSVESLDGLQRKMTVQVPADQIEREVEQRLRRVSKTANLKGFRPGKAPFNVIRQRYGKDVRQEVVSELLRSSYAEAVTQEKLQPAGNPHIETSKAASGEGLEYTATFEIYPEVALQKVEGLKIDQKIADITDKDIDRVMENLREQRAHWHVVEQAAKQGDQVNIDFNGTLDGEPFDGGNGTAIDVIPGSGQMLADFEDGLIGATAGESRDVTVHFPDDYPSAEVAGRDVQFAITVNSVSERHLPEIDSEFCESFGIESGSLDELRQGIRDNMAREMEEKVRANMREQILDALVKHNPVEVPQTLVDSEVEQLRNDAARRMGAEQSGQLPPAELFTEAAKRRVSLGLLIGKIVEQQDIKADSAATEARLQQLATQFGESDEVLKAYREDPRLMSQIEMAVIEDKVVTWLIEQAKTKNRKVSFQDLMQPEG